MHGKNQDLLETTWTHHQLTRLRSMLMDHFNLMNLSAVLQVVPEMAKGTMLVALQKDFKLLLPCRLISGAFTGALICF